MIRKFFSLMRGGSEKETDASGKPQTVSHKPNTKARSPEAICGIDPKKMSEEEIRKRLAELFRRHNQAEASLDPELREEARIMLDAIVACRQKYIDKD